jgi:hypothetical protein
MIRDAQTALWEAAALTATAVSTNCYDTGAPGVSGGISNDIATGEPLCLVISVGVAADLTTGDETYQFQVITATATDLTTGQRIIAQSEVFATTRVTSKLTPAGKVVIVPIPPGSIDQRYLGARYVGGGTTPTITVTCWIAPMSMIDSGAEYYKTAIVVS